MSEGHWISKQGDNCFSIGWKTRVKRGRLSDLVSHWRSTDMKGAMRFAKKWGLRMPEKNQ